MSGQARLRVTGSMTEGHSVPAEVLVRVVSALQRSVWLLGAAEEARAVGRRFKPDQKLRQRLTLRLSAAEEGSYAVPLAVVDERPQPELSAGTPILETVFALWAAIARNDMSAARGLVPGDAFFSRLLRETQHALPARGEPWGVALGLASAEVELGEAHRDTLAAWLGAPSEQRDTTIIGELIKVDFSRKSLSVLYPPNRREIECSYTEDLEEDLLAARRGPVQVTGTFILGADGHPERLRDVTVVEPVDLSLIVISELDVGDRTLSLAPPLTVQPELDEDTEQTFVASVPALHLVLAGATRSALVDDLVEQLRFVWREYAEASKDDLTEDAQALRDVLHARMRWAP